MYPMADRATAHLRHNCLQCRGGMPAAPFRAGDCVLLQCASLGHRVCHASRALCLPPAWAGDRVVRKLEPRVALLAPAPHCLRRAADGPKLVQAGGPQELV